MALVEYTLEDGIAHIVLNRPRVLNALTDEMIRELKAALLHLDDDDGASVGVLSGAGRAFCSGGDVRERHLRPAEELKRLGGAAARDARIEDLSYRFTNFKPLIAAVHGFAVGAGLYLALMCELIVAAEETKFQIVETARGVDATRFWGLLRDRASGGFATDVAITGRFWDAKEGLRRGAVDRLASDTDHVSTAKELAAQIMSNPPLSVRATTETRRGVNEAIELRARQTRAKDLHLTMDFREAAVAFVEKRKPVFRGE